MEPVSDLLNRDFFALFELSPQFDIDLSQVQQRYHQLQAQVHPDRFAAGSDAQKRLSMQLTSQLNEAMQTLKDPVLRAAYLLKLKGVDIQLENETTMDAGFLMQQLELRETLAAIKQAGADDARLDRLDALAGDVRRQSEQIEAAFSEALEAGELEQAREQVRKLQFLQKAQKEIDSLSAEIEDALMG